MAKKYFEITGVVRGGHQSFFNQYPEARVMGGTQKFFYFIGFIVAPSSTPLLRSVYNNSSDDLTLYLDGKNLDKIEKVEFAFSDGTIKQADSFEQLRGEVEVDNIPGTEEKTWREIGIETAQLLERDQERPDDGTVPAPGESIFSIYDAPWGDRKNSVIAHELGRDLRNIPGAHVYNPLLVNSYSDIPTTFQSVLGFEIEPLIIAPGDNVFGSSRYAHIPRRIVIDEEQQEQFINKTLLNIESTVTVKATIALQLPDLIQEAEQPAPVDPCKDKNDSLITLYENWPRAEEPGVFSDSLAKYVIPDDDTSGLKVTVFTDQNGLDWGNGPKSFTVIGDWVRGDWGWYKYSDDRGPLVEIVNGLPMTIYGRNCDDRFSLKNNGRWDRALPR